MDTKLSDQDPAVALLCAEHKDEIDRMIADVQNGFSFAKVSFIYSRLKRMGPWKTEDLTMDLIFEIDMMQSALVTEYARVFTTGVRQVSRKKVPKHLRPTHDAIIQLRNKRYAHDDSHPSVRNSGDIRIEGEKVIFEPGANLKMALGAPREWEELISWLGEYVYEQGQQQLKRLSEKTGYEWVMPHGAPPTWL